jgi:peptidoglycan hydrolase-like amidase
MRSTSEPSVLQRSSALALALVFASSGSISSALAQTDGRPRRVSAEWGTANSPIVRVALMTDVSAVTLACSSGLTVREGALAPIKKGRVINQVRADVRREVKSERNRRKTTYRILVASFEDQTRAEKLASDLRHKYREQVEISESRKESIFDVWLGKFEDAEDADDLLPALRKSGYKSARVEESGEAAPPSRVNSKPNPVYSKGDRFGATPGDQKTSSSSSLAAERGPQVVAVDAGRLIASSSDRLVIGVSESEEKVEGKQGSKKSQEATRNVSYDFSREPRDRAAKGEEESSRVTNVAPGSTAAAFVSVDGKQYRGEIQLVLNKRGRINVINTVGVEDYLRSVVPMELSPIGFPQLEALKAQAVAARSYALFHRGEHEDESYDLRDDARSQVYGGVAAEHELSDRAIEETAGIVATAMTADGRWLPIDAMYTANCGGHTENNEDVFGTRPVSYLRAVACEVDPDFATGRELVSSSQLAPLTGPDGRSIARELALLDVLSFQVPHQVTSRYLGAPVDEPELRAWSERAARICAQSLTNLRITNSLAGLAAIVASAVYGEGRAAVLVTPADASYILGGLDLGDDQWSRSDSRVGSQERSSLALLMKNGILRLPAGGMVNMNSPVSRALAIETFGRAVLSRVGDGGPLKGSSQGLQTSNTERFVGGLISKIASGVENGRLMIGTGRPSDGLVGSAQPRGYMKVETSSTHVGRMNESAESNSASRPSGGARAATSNVEIPRGSAANMDWSPGIEIAKDARLFRDFAGESYQVSRLTLIGGERVLYHANALGQVDFLETSPSDRSAATDRFSRVASWQERINADELSARLSRSHASVGQPKSIAPVALSTSGRVTELEITGTAGRTRLRGSHIKSVLGLRENLFVVDAETDATGRVVAFVFTGRGWGHGVGMCQTGAYGLAREGYSYKQILQKYYSGIRVQRIY